jgi:hypothetical protein
VFQFILDNSLLLLAGAVLGLAWAKPIPAVMRSLRAVTRPFVNDVAMVAGGPGGFGRTWRT